MTVFAVVVAFAFVLLLGALSHVVSVRLDGMETERALKAALRSALSAFEPALAAYGLFAVRTDENISDIYETTVRRNLEKNGINPARVEPPAFRYPLADQTIFERQILESMQYMAPVEFMRLLAEPTKEVEPLVSATRDFQLASEELDRHVSLREQRMDDFSNLFRRLKEIASSVARTAEHRGSPDDEEPNDSLLRAQADVRAAYSECLRAISEAEQADRLIDETVRRHMRDPKWSDAGLVGLQEIWKTVRVYGASHFDRLRTDLASAVAPVLAQATGDAFTSAADRLADLEARLQPFEADRTTRNRRYRENIDSEKQKIQMIRAQAQRPALTGCRAEDVAVYERLESAGGTVDRFLTYNELPERPSDARFADPLGQEPLEAARSMTFRLRNLSELAKTVRDHMYVNEFALTRFNRRTYELDAMRGRTVHLSRPETHVLKNQEAEYILYGMSACQVNLALAYGETFLFRAVVGAAQALADSETLAKAASPAALLWAVLAEGFVAANNDMQILVAGGSVPLFGRMVPIEWTYKDHLRLFFLLHGTNTRTIARMQALIEINTGIDLLRTATYLEGRVSASVRPNPVAAAWMRISQKGDENDENRVELFRTAHASY